MFRILTQALSRFPRAFIWIATSLGLSAVLLVFAVVAIDTRNTAWHFQEQGMRNIAMLAEQDLARNIESFDLSLQAVRDGVGDPAIMRLPPSIRQQVLFDRSATAEGLGSIVVLDETGRVTLMSDRLDPPAADFADRDYFKALRDAKTDIGLYVSRPFRSRLRRGEWLVGFARRVSDGDGAFRGVVIGAVRLDYVAATFARVDLGPGGTVGLFRDDGVAIVGSDMAIDGIGRDIGGSEVFRRMRTDEAGLFVSRNSEDGIERLYAFRRLARLPLIIDVGRAVGPMEQSWRHKTLILTAILVAMSAAVVALVTLLDKEFLRRIRAEERSAALARTDGLTSLANRRMFDEALRREWKGARRNRTPLALLIFDSDSFKAFNDHYGHLAGDSALVAIASVIARSVRRASDLAARYGGEEFVVLLPKTELAGAAALAQTIRLGVHALAIPHARSALGRVTVSCGVACLVPDEAMDAQALVRAADQALYRAKQAGRHGVVLHELGSAEAAQTAA